MEDVESGFVESERMDSGLPASMSGKSFEVLHPVHVPLSFSLSGPTTRNSC